MNVAELRQHVAHQPEPLKRVITDTAAIVELWEPGFGHLITVKLAEGITKADAERISGFLQQWWSSCSANYKGAKMLVLMPGYDILLNCEEALKELGYERVNKEPENTENQAI